MKNKSFSSLVGSMLKIGLIGFGGGTALIPVIEHEIVERAGLVPEEEYNRDVMIASITPGALPVEIAAGVGHEIAGNAGMIASSAAMAFPGAFLTLLLLVLFSGMSDALRSQFSVLSKIVSVFIIVLLVKYVWGTVRLYNTRRGSAICLFLICSVFLLCSGKNLYQLTGLSGTPLFSLSTVQVLGAAFFVILFTKGQPQNLRRSVPALAIAACYFLCAGKAHLIPTAAESFLLAVMTALSLIGLRQSVLETKTQTIFPLKSLTISVGCWLAFTLLLSLPAIFLTRATLPFLGTGLVSSIMSFGGGDAYLTVAEGLFVDTGIVSGADFYGSIVTVANALPGSILCKVLTGIGYYLGYGLHQSALEGVLVAVSGFTCSVAASGSIYIVVRAVYQKYERLQIFSVIRRLIRPIISGLLLNVALSLYMTVIH